MNTPLDKLIEYLRLRRVHSLIPQSVTVCDLGCGPKANFLKKISIKISKGIGLDPKVTDAKEGNIQLLNYKLEKNNPLENESVDVVTILAVLEHLSYPKEILKEAFRILKPTGKIIITVPAPSAKPILEMLALLRLIDKNSIDEHKYYFGRQEIVELLKNSGFNGESIQFQYFEFRLNQLIVAEK